MKRFLKWALPALLVLLLAGFAWLWFGPCSLGGCAPVTDLERFEAEGSRLLDSDGEPFAVLATVNRRIVSLDSLPEHLPQAFLAVEDRRFFDHGGVDWKRFFGAMAANVRAGGVEEGGSTVTMQLARNLFPERLDYRERTLTRKVYEVRIARQIERAFPKEKILELYLNHIYLGEGAYGVEAAAQKYFGRPAAELTLAEAATLGGLPVAPSRINPLADSAAALERRDLVLREMADAGFATPDEVAAALEEPLDLVAGADDDGAQTAPWFVERVRRELEQQVGSRFYTAGLRVHTTLDADVQEAAEAQLVRQLDAIEAGAYGAFRHPTYPEAKGETEDGGTPYLQGMAVVMDAQTGAVLALVGGRDWSDSNFDRAFQAVRQPGSAFKPFVYLAALERRIPPTRRLEDEPLRIEMARGRYWEPRNYTGRFDGPITLRDALTRSKNVATVRLAQEVGMPAVIAEARDLGISTEIPSFPSTALGAAAVRPIELVRAYGALANDGEMVEPRFIERVEDRHGNVVWEAAPTSTRVVDPAAAYVLTSILRDVVDRGTGARVRAAGFRGPAAGKTGTTNDASDVWFVGYTPRHVGAVWIGMDRPQTIVRGASGGTLAAPVWARIMRQVYAGGASPGEWRRPGGVSTAEVDRATGQLVDADCPAQGPTYTEVFVGSPPPRPLCYPPLEGWTPYDSAWIDEEWDVGGMPEDTFAVPDLERAGIDWPELEARRDTGVGAPPLPGTDSAGAAADSVRRDTSRARPAEPTRPTRPEPAPPSEPAPDTAGGPDLLGEPADAPAPPGAR